MNDQTTLQFPSIEKLWAFKNEVNAVVFEMNANKKWLTCKCTKDEIEIATTKYGARVVYPE